MNATLANLAVIAATAGTVTFLIPQILKLVRTGDSEGVSTTWPALGFVTNVGWFAYVIAQAFWAAILAPLITFVSYAVTLWAPHREGVAGELCQGSDLGRPANPDDRSLRLGHPRRGVGPLLRRDGRTFGVERFQICRPGTWWIGALEASLWGYFGLYNRAPGIITFGVVGITASTLMLYRYYSTRRPVESPISEPVH